MNIDNIQRVRFRIPFPWTGWYYSLHRDETLPGRLWLCFSWGSGDRAGYVMFAVRPFFGFEAQRGTVNDG